MERPDLFYFIQRIGLHIELDENGSVHEDNDDRLRKIHNASLMDGTYVIRINPDEHISGGNEFEACFQRIVLTNGPVLMSTLEFERRFQIIESEIRRVMELAISGVLPTEETWKTCLFF
jgi:hypothetical protein